MLPIEAKRCFKSQWGSQNRNGAGRRSRDPADRRARELARSSAQDQRTDQEIEQASVTERSLRDREVETVVASHSAGFRLYWR